jgi:hypothetical protein
MPGGRRGYPCVLGGAGAACGLRAATGGVQAGAARPEKAAAVRIARALYLRFLLSSAPSRLQPWCDGEDLEHMPRSHMFEWISHDFERLELAALEDAMTPAEAASYARALEGVDD